MNRQKVVLITGCSSGIGLQAALLFARKGYFTFASVRNLENDGVKELLDVKRKENLSIEVVLIDVSNDESVKKGMAEIKQKTLDIDVLINNAGFGSLGPLEEYSVEEIKEQYDTNIFGMIRMIKEVIPIMRKRHSGSIINISSINGLVPFPLWSVYSSSKYAIESLTESLRFEVSHFGIRVSLVEPGSFSSKFALNKKLPKKISPDSPYTTLSNHFFTMYDNVTQKKLSRNNVIARITNTRRVAQLLFRITEDPHPKLRYRIGTDAHALYYLNKFLPVFVKDWILHKIYKW